MSPLTDKFERHLELLSNVATGSFDLRTDRRLWKKVRQFYIKRGLIFTGDESTDYNILVNYLYEDLFVNN